MPNGKIEYVTNYTYRKKNRVDAFFTLADQQDFPKAKATLLQAVDAIEYVIKEPSPPMVLVHELSVFGVMIKLRVWTPTEHHRKMKYILREQGLLALNREGISLARIKPGVTLH